MTAAEQPHCAWSDALRAAQAFAVDPQGLGGVRIRACASSARDALVKTLAAALSPTMPMRRIPLSVSEETLSGSVDLAATLQTGRRVQTRGLLDQPGLLVFPMAERMEATLAGRLASALDDGAARGIALLALDEGATAEEQPPAALLERLGLWIDLSGLSRAPSDDVGVDTKAIAQARGMLADVVAGDAIVEVLCGAAASLGILSVRASLFAVKAARASAALDGRLEVSEDDAAFAARVVLGPRAQCVPMAQAPSEDDAEQEPSQSDAPETSPDAEADTNTNTTNNLEDAVIAAAKAALPQGLLAMAGNQPTRSANRRAGTSGTQRASRRRGRPLASRPGSLAQGRLDILATLKAAAPWQKLRADPGASSAAPIIKVRRSDFQIQRYKERTDSLTIFVVDASGSAAAQRLAEAKGAVELLLADCYVRRDQVALIAFRKAEASVVLPPTRSLARAKRHLADMPAGGGTPLATAIASACALADGARRNGQDPLVVFLTDGSANITRDGAPDRTRAEEDARRAARALNGLGLRSILIDISMRERPFSRELGGLLGARHVWLPRADANALARTVAQRSSA